MDIVKWLWNISNHSIDIYYDNGEAFEWSCARGHLDVVEWLWEISNGTFDLHSNNYFGFKWCCEEGHLNMAKWLWKKSNENIDNYQLNNAFKQTCIIGNFDVMEWLWDISNYTIDLHIDNDFLFLINCVKKHFKIVKFLVDFSENGFQNISQIPSNILDNLEKYMLNDINFCIKNRRKLIMFQNIYNNKIIKNKYIWFINIAKKFMRISPNILIKTLKNEIFIY